VKLRHKCLSLADGSSAEETMFSLICLYPPCAPRSDEFKCMALSTQFIDTMVKHVYQATVRHKRQSNLRRICTSIKGSFLKRDLHGSSTSCRRLVQVGTRSPPWHLLCYAPPHFLVSNDIHHKPRTMQRNLHHGVLYDPHVQ